MMKKRVSQVTDKIKSLHFVGVGGIGMSGIAEVFLNQGFQVSGSDVAESDTTRRLEGLGVKIALGHRAENVHPASVVVISSAIRPQNPEIVEARRLRIPVIPRAEMLGELMRGKTGIAVAGTHGKTTTTSMLATILTVAGLDPTLVIGGKVDSLGGNAKLGQGTYVVAEADESDGSFLHLPATFGIITNIDSDHLDHFGDLEHIDRAFVDFVGKLPFYGLAVVCGDDPGVKRCLAKFTKPTFTYGLNSDSDLIAADLVTQGWGTTFSVSLRTGGLLGKVTLSVPGRHNVLNALGAIGIALQLDISWEEIKRALEMFRGVKRRFDIKWQSQSRQQVIVDDYGHHPTEVVATLAAARSFWNGRIICVFQPHRYTRTQHCRSEFLKAFSQGDVVFLTDIYSAGEDPIQGVSSEAMIEDLKKAAKPGQEFYYSGDLNRTRDRVCEIFKPGDLILCLGAGSITRLPDQIIARIQTENE